MANTIQIKRGLEANRSSVTPAVGELLYTTDGKKVYIGDGSTAGGNEVAPPASGIQPMIEAASAVITPASSIFRLTVSGVQLAYSIDLDATYEALICYGGGYIYVQVYNKSTDAMGTMTAVNSTPADYLPDGFDVYKVDGSTLLFGYGDASGNFYAQTASISGTTVTPNTAVSVSGGGNFVPSIKKFGSYYIVQHANRTTSTGYISCLSISSGAITVNSTLSFGANTMNYTNFTLSQIVKGSDTHGFVIGWSSWQRFYGFYLIGSSLVAAGSASNTNMVHGQVVYPTDNGWIVRGRNSSYQTYLTLIKHSGTAITSNNLNVTNLYVPDGCNFEVFDGNNFMLIGMNTASTNPVLRVYSYTTASGSIVQSDYVELQRYAFQAGAHGFINPTDTTGRLFGPLGSIDLSMDGSGNIVVEAHSRTRYTLPHSTTTDPYDATQYYARYPVSINERLLPSAISQAREDAGEFYTPQFVMNKTDSGNQYPTVMQAGIGHTVYYNAANDEYQGLSTSNRLRSYSTDDNFLWVTTHEKIDSTSGSFSTIQKVALA